MVIFTLFDWYPELVVVVVVFYMLRCFMEEFHLSPKVLIKRVAKGWKDVLARKMMSPSSFIIFSEKEGEN